MRFAKEHNKKGLKRKQADNAKATSARVRLSRRSVKPKELKPTIPKGDSHKLSRLACIAHPKFGKRAYIAKGLRLCQPKAKAKAQTKAPARAQAPKGAQAPTKVQSRGLYLSM
ncbi:60S ribosomal protein L29-like [Camelus ferus]|uniref:60S ribosomal protein L29-like n=1 Tax=Camelus ferus TaxID=419612 RepID=A0A8B8S2C0_CAMFR|nr:60S ribosomal protein L29-like [Camelus ferus]